MYVHPGDESVTPCLVRDGYWESWITVWMLKNINSNSLFLDIGANTGYYAMLALMQGAEVQAFEPNPPYYEMLRATLDYHKINNSAKLYNVALSDKKGFATLHVPEKLHGSASLSAIDAKWVYHEVTVPTETLNSFYQKTSKQEIIIKIDAESAEEKIWDGASLFTEPNDYNSVVFVIEYTPGAYSDKFISKLEAFGPLAKINFAGKEEPITAEWLKSQQDWSMLVIRKDKT